MKILIDIGHPGHVHYFRNFIKIMESKGHKFQIVARDKEVAFKLLDYYKIPFLKRGKGGKGILGKILYILLADIRILKIALKVKPDLFLSFSSTYAGHVAFLMRKPHIVFDDTEHAKFEHLMYKPFANVILNPACFYKTLGKKQLFFNGYMELCYLHKNYFQRDENIFKLLNIEQDEKFVIIRFVSFEAGHDLGHHGISLNDKYSIIGELQKYCKIFISSESRLPENLEQFRMKLPPEKLHDALSFASLYIGEGGTTASETSILGIPSIYINSLPLMGYLKDEEKEGLLFHLNGAPEVLEKAKEILKISDLRKEFDSKKNNLLKDKIDVTAFMVWFIENYPKSFEIMKQDPDYQFRFK